MGTLNLWQLDGSSPRGQALRQLASQLSLVCRDIAPDSWHSTIREILQHQAKPACDAANTTDAEPEAKQDSLQSQELILFDGLADETLKALFSACRAAGFRLPALKAVVTTQNSGWTLAELARELMEEHRFMTMYQHLRRLMQQTDAWLADHAAAVQPELVQALADAERLLKQPEPPDLATLQGVGKALQEALIAAVESTAGD